jgi:hypothetical protein
MVYYSAATEPPPMDREQQLWLLAREGERGAGFADSKLCARKDSKDASRSGCVGEFGGGGEGIYR